MADWCELSSERLFHGTASTVTIGGQVVLPVAAGFLSLVRKRCREVRQVYSEGSQLRRRLDFALDVSKQFVAAVWLLVLTVLFGPSAPERASSTSASACEWLSAAAMLDGIVGVLVQLVFISAVACFVSGRCQRRGRRWLGPGIEDYRTGVYRDAFGRFRGRKYVKQLAMWLVFATCARYTVLWLLFQYSEMWLVVIGAPLQLLAWSSSLQSFVAEAYMTCVLSSMAAFQCWMTDDFLKQRYQVPYSAATVSTKPKIGKSNWLKSLLADGAPNVSNGSAQDLEAPLLYQSQQAANQVVRSAGLVSDTYSEATLHAGQDVDEEHLIGINPGQATEPSCPGSCGENDDIPTLGRTVGNVSSLREGSHALPVAELYGQLVPGSSGVESVLPELDEFGTLLSQRYSELQELGVRVERMLAGIPAGALTTSPAAGIQASGPPCPQSPSSSSSPPRQREPEAPAISDGGFGGDACQHPARSISERSVVAASLAPDMVVDSRGQDRSPSSQTRFAPLSSDDSVAEVGREPKHDPVLPPPCQHCFHDSTSRSKELLSTVDSALLVQANATASEGLPGRTEVRASEADTRDDRIPSSRRKLSSVQLDVTCGRPGAKDMEPACQAPIRVLARSSRSPLSRSDTVDADTPRRPSSVSRGRSSSLSLLTPCLTCSGTHSAIPSVGQECAHSKEHGGERPSRRDDLPGRQRSSSCSTSNLRHPYVAAAVAEAQQLPPATMTSCVATGESVLANSIRRPADVSVSSDAQQAPATVFLYAGSRSGGELDSPADPRWCAAEHPQAERVMETGDDVDKKLADLMVKLRGHPGRRGRAQHNATGESAGMAARARISEQPAVDGSDRQRKLAALEARVENLFSVFSTAVDDTRL